MEKCAVNFSNTVAMHPLLKKKFLQVAKLLFVCIVISAGLILQPFAFAADQLSRESKLKATYLFNFTKFIEWQDPPSTETSAFIQVCVDAPRDFIEFLTELTAGRVVGVLRRSVNVVSLDSATDCDLIFVQQAEMMEDLIFPDAVIVADSCTSDCPQASIIFYIDTSRVRFEVNLEQIRSLNVFVSSDLLKLARINN